MPFRINRSLVLLICLIFSSCGEDTGITNEYYGAEINNLSCKNIPKAKGKAVNPVDFFSFRKMQLEFKNAYVYSEFQYRGKEATSSFLGKINADDSLETLCLDLSESRSNSSLNETLTIPFFSKDGLLKIQNNKEVSFVVCEFDGCYSSISVGEIDHSSLVELYYFYRDGYWTGAEIFRFENTISILFHSTFSYSEFELRFKFQLLEYEIIKEENKIL